MDNSCPICYEDLDLKPNSKLIYCNHEFHIECIHHWLKIKSNCPICRNPLNNEFNGIQYFLKNNLLNCKLTLDTEKNLNIKYNHLYDVSIPLTKIKKVYINKQFTNIVYNHFNHMMILKFKIPNAFYFLECFRTKVISN